MENFWKQFRYWIGGLLGGPGISVILQKWVLPNPSEQLVGLIYILGFGIYFFAIFLNYRQRVKQVEFLKYMVHTHEEKMSPDGMTETKDYGRIDENSVKIIEKLKDIL